MGSIAIALLSVVLVFKQRWNNGRLICCRARLEVISFRFVSASLILIAIVVVFLRAVGQARIKMGKSYFFILVFEAVATGVRADKKAVRVDLQTGILVYC